MRVDLMKLKLKSLPITIFLTLFPFAVAYGQWVTSDNQIPINPNSGLTPNPVFIYDRDTGIFSIDNAGDNGIVETQFNRTLEGDDFGFISLAISFSGQNVSTVRIVDDQIEWSAPVIFNDKIQLIGNAITGQFLTIFVSPTPILQLDPGLTAADFVGPSGFVEIETGMNYAPAVPGITFFSDGDPLATGAFRIVPEPDLASMFGLMFLIALRFSRRRFTAR